MRKSNKAFIIISGLGLLLLQQTSCQSALAQENTGMSDWIPPPESSAVSAAASPGLSGWINPSESTIVTTSAAAAPLQSQWISPAEARTASSGQSDWIGPSTSPNSHAMQSGPVTAGYAGQSEWLTPQAKSASSGAYSSPPRLATKRNLTLEDGISEWTVPAGTSATTGASFSEMPGQNGLGTTAAGAGSMLELAAKTIMSPEAIGLFQSLGQCIPNGGLRNGLMPLGSRFGVRR
jgi:hypothetical protein